MLIECVGCSGAGKSTLAAQLARRLRAEGLPVAYQPSDDVRLRATACRMADAIPGLVRSLADAPSRRFLGFAWTCIARRRVGLAWTLARCAAVARVTGQHLALRQAGTATIRVIDEGILGLAHLVLSGHSPAVDHEVDRFTQLVPLPDLIVCVDAPTDTLVRRTRSRSDAPREWRTLDDDALAARVSMVRRALARMLDTQSLARRVIAQSVTDGPSVPEPTEPTIRAIEAAFAAASPRATQAP